MFWVKDITDFHLCPMLLQSNNPPNPPKITKIKKALESLKEHPQGHKKQQFDHFAETKIILGDNR